MQKLNRIQACLITDGKATTFVTVKSYTILPGFHIAPPYSSTANIHLMPGMSGSTASGNGIVYVSGKVSTNSLVVDGIEINPRGLTAVFG